VVRDLLGELAPPCSGKAAELGLQAFR
jgi:hypothetical protein